MKNAYEATKGDHEMPKTADAIFAIMRLLPIPAFTTAVIMVALMWIVYGITFFKVLAAFLLLFMLAVSILLGLLISLLMEKERTEQQGSVPREAEQEQLKGEQKERTYKASSQNRSAGHTVPVRPHELRALPYREYLQTPHWKGRREDKLRAVGRRCQVCNRGPGALDVHHRTYERLGQELDVDLTVLCRVCHNIFHEHGRLGR